VGELCEGRDTETDRIMRDFPLSLLRIFHLEEYP
jgi:hypothetical protein